MKCPPTLANESRPPATVLDSYSTFVKSVASKAKRFFDSRSSAQTIPFEVPFADALGTVPLLPNTDALWDEGVLLSFAWETVNTRSAIPEGPMYTRPLK